MHTVLAWAFIGIYCIVSTHGTGDEYTNCPELKTTGWCCGEFGGGGSIQKACAESCKDEECQRPTEEECIKKCSSGHTWANVGKVATCTCNGTGGAGQSEESVYNLGHTEGECNKQCNGRYNWKNTNGVTTCTCKAGGGGNCKNHYKDDDCEESKELCTKSSLHRLNVGDLHKTWKEWCPKTCDACSSGGGSGEGGSKPCESTRSGSTDTGKTRGSGQCEPCPNFGSPWDGGIYLLNHCCQCGGDVRNFDSATCKCECGDEERQKTVKEAVLRGWPRDCSKPEQASGCTLMPLTQAEKDLIVKEHNDLRRKAYNGNEDGLPGAKDPSKIKDLKWNDELATIAEGWAKQCYAGHNPDKTYFENKANFPHIGENIYAGGLNYATYNAVKGWYEEVKDYVKDKKATPNTFGSYSGTAKVGHFTQVVWATTTDIGCGVTKNGEQTYVVCNYGPAGNMQGGQVYPAA